ncbi:thioredoxin domain-containing protein [Arthrobacter sp. NPDC090010]|uniref:thioredoxin domain-containing protein n=1 Tax=Arthrobacter sp. NPDC090010 TaxID=3363942 RepID=UPI0038002182
MVNHLEGQSSLYLRQHAHQEVDWHVFGPEAFAEARERDVPVFLSIGYAACHWCHVMAHESFDDAAVAAYLNAHFVPIKVDREERPEVDAVYMTATQALTGEGGWPMSVFALPDGRAFFAGTYFPPSPRGGRPSFSQLLTAVREAWADRRTQLEDHASRLAAGLGDYATAVRIGASTASDLGAQDLDAAVAQLEQSESRDGGFGTAPKFPPSPLLPFLTTYAASGRPESVRAAAVSARTLAAMARSALRDQLDGGFCRYSVTADWSVPHFEKMLYDNALLLRAYTGHLRLLRSPEGSALRGGLEAIFPLAEVQRVIEGLAGFLCVSAADGGLTDPAGAAFLSAVDADSQPSAEQLRRAALTEAGLHEREGAFSLWTPDELSELLGEDDGGLLADLMNVRSQGTVSALGSPLHPGAELDVDGLTILDRARPVLLAARAERPHPAVDDKVVAAWNAMAITAFAEAGASMERSDWIERAVEAAENLRRVHWDQTTLTLYRVSHAGLRGPIPGLLEDYAHALDASLALYSATGDISWYSWARDLAAAVDDGFLGSDGLLNEDQRHGDAASDALRAAYGGASPVEASDGATPAPASVLAGAWLRLASLNGESTLLDRALAVANQAAAAVEGQPRVSGAANAVRLVGLLGGLEVAVVSEGDPGELLATAWRSARPGLTVACGRGDNGVPLFEGRPAPATGALAYVCRDMVCRAPVSTVPELEAALAAESLS